MAMPRLALDAPRLHAQKRGDGLQVVLDPVVDFLNDGRFDVEFPLLGNGIGGVSDPVYRKVVLTSFGLTRPHAGAIVSGNLCTVGGSSASPENSSAGRVGMRAHAIIGPLQ